MHFIEKKFVVGAFQCNCRLLICPHTGESVLIDAGDEAQTILEGLKGLTTPTGLPIQVKYLLHTHGHLDHIGATRTVYEALSAADSQKAHQTALKIALHRGDELLYQNLKMQGQLFGIHYDDPLPIQHYLEDEEEIRFGRLKFTVLHTPGHSPGSVSFLLHPDSQLHIPQAVYSGDTLFQGSVGRTDLWGGDQDLMFKSIRQRLLTLDGDTLVCPGHGEDSTIQEEALENPFLR